MLHHLLQNRSQSTKKHSFVNTVLKTPSYTNVPPPAPKSVPDHQKALIPEHCFEDTKLYECSTTCSKIGPTPQIRRLLVGVADHEKALISEHRFEDTKVYEYSTTCSKIGPRPPKSTHF